MQSQRSNIGLLNRSVRLRGFTLTELMVTVMMIGIMAAITVPSYRQAIEQSRADVAGSTLRAIWAAERLYWLGNQTFTNDLGLLKGDLGLLDPKLSTAEPAGSSEYWNSYYWYDVTLNYDSASPPNVIGFEAKAHAANYTGRTSTLKIDESGEISGNVSGGGGRTITPIDFW